MDKKTKLIVLSVILVAVVALVAVPVVKNYMITKDPINHIMYSTVKTDKEDNVSSTISIKAELDEKLAVEKGVFNQVSQSPEDMAKFANTLLKNFEILYNINVVTDDVDDVIKMDADIGMNYSGKNIINGKMNFKPWQAGIEVPKLYDKSFYVDINEVLKKEGYEFDLKDIDIKAYLDLIKKEDDLYKAVEENYEPYKDVFYNFLEGKVEKLDSNTITLKASGEEKELKATKYKLNVNIMDIYDVYADILEVAKKDENVKALVTSRVEEFKNLVIENKDYEKADLTEEEFKEGMKKIQDGIEKDWDKSIDEMITQLRSVSDMPEMAQAKNIDSNFIIAIDKDHMIRQIELGMQTEFIKIKETVSYNAFGDEVKVNIQEKDENRVNLLELEQNQALAQEIGSEAVNNIGSELLGGEAVEALIADIKTESKVLPENEGELIRNNVNSMINQARMFLPFMLQGMGL